MHLKLDDETIRHKDKVAIITGGSSGFGLALAKRLISQGAKVVLGDLSEKKGNEIVAKLNAAKPGVAVFVEANVTSKTDQKKLFHAAISNFGYVDYVFNNAGIGETANFYVDDNVDQWVDVLRIDTEAVIIGTRLAYDYFLRNNRPGVVVNTASLAGLYPQPSQPVYAAAKGAVVHFTRSVAPVGAAKGIYCADISPSFSPTGILATGEKLFGAKFKEATKERVPVEQVIDAFMRVLNDPKRYNGQSVRITPKNGIDVHPFRTSRPQPVPKL